MRSDMSVTYVCQQSGKDALHLHGLRAPEASTDP